MTRHCGWPLSAESNLGPTTSWKLKPPILQPPETESANGRVCSEADPSPAEPPGENPARPTL